MYRNMGDFLTADALLKESEEYDLLGKSLGAGLSADDWAKENLDFKGMDWGYRRKSRNMDEDAPGLDSYKKLFAHKGGKIGHSDTYLYNLALTQAYQQIAEELATVKRIPQSDIDRVMGDFPTTRVEQRPHYTTAGKGRVPIRKSWKEYKDFVEKYASQEIIDRVHQSASSLSLIHI